MQEFINHLQNIMYLGLFKSDTIKQVGMKEKKVPQKKLSSIAIVKIDMGET